MVLLILETGKNSQKITASVTHRLKDRLLHSSGPSRAASCDAMHDTSRVQDMLTANQNLQIHDMLIDQRRSGSPSLLPTSWNGRTTRARAADSKASSNLAAFSAHRYLHLPVPAKRPWSTERGPDMLLHTVFALLLGMVFGKWWTGVRWDGWACHWPWGIEKGAFLRHSQICLLQGKGSSVFGSAHQRLAWACPADLVADSWMRWNWDASHLLVLHSAPPKHLRRFYLKASLDPQNPHGHQLRGQFHEATTRLHLELRSKRPVSFLAIDMFQSLPRGKQCDSCFHLSGDGPSHCPLSSLPRKWSRSAGGRPWHRWLPDFLEVAPLVSHNADMIFDRTLNALLCLSTNYNNYNNRRRFDLPCLFPA